MSGIFPQQSDGGLPPNPASPLNPSHAYQQQFVNPTNTGALYYGNGCDVRLRPEVVNSVVSEIHSTADSARLSYDANKLTNLELAIRYLIQRGLPDAAPAIGGPNYYTATLDPPLTHYNEGLVLVLVPNAQNGGAVFVDVNGRGNVQVLRNDGSTMVTGDWRANAPALITYHGGYFWTVGLIHSQIPPVQNIPKILTGDFDAWVRPDGNDTTGDGAVNSPSRAFRTIQGCWGRIGGMFIASPFFALNIRLGIPGDYEGGRIWNYGGLVRIIGDELAPASYRIMSELSGVATSTQSIWFSASKGMILGVTMANTGAAPVSPHALLVDLNASVVVKNCIFRQDSITGPGQSVFIWVRTGGTLLVDTNNQFLGQNIPMYIPILVSNGSVFAPLHGVYTHVLNFSDVSWPANVGCFYARELSDIDLTACPIIQSNCHGPRYAADMNSVILSAGQTLPGDAPGQLSTGGQFL